LNAVISAANQASRWDTLMLNYKPGTEVPGYSQ